MKILKRLLAATLVLAVLGAGLVWLTLRGSLPQVDGTLQQQEIAAEIVIERDADGIPTIRATNRADLAFATGFVHGQDRFFQMDLSRRRAAGELAELFGEIALPLDRRNRLHRFRSRARNVAAGLAGVQREMADSYTAGVNAGLASLGAKPFEYFLTGSAPAAWRTEDSFLVAYNMFIELNDETASRDIRRGMAHDALPRTLFEFLYPDGTDWDAPIEGDARPAAPLPTADEVGEIGPSTVVRRAPGDYEVLLPGSNNWAVSGALTDSGRAIVANDMHLGISVPNVFYRARLRVEGTDTLELNGVTLPGAPILIAGSNGHIAFGNTNSYGDWTDAVVVRPGDRPDTYLTSRGALPFDKHLETIEVKDGDAEILEITETIWGPVVEHPAIPSRLVAVRWIAHDVHAVNLVGIELERATTVRDALAIANRMGMPPQNFVVGDADGNIGWTIAGQIPVRTGYDPSLPADWSDGDGWSGWLEPDRYPRILNPASGRIWTANTRVVDGDNLALVGDGGYDLGARGRQIRDGLFARSSFTPQDLLDIQNDDRALFLERWRDLLLETLDEAATENHPGRRTYQMLAAGETSDGTNTMTWQEGWTGRAAAHDVGYRLVRDFRSEVRDRVFDMLIQPVRERVGDDVELRMSNQFEGSLWTLVSERPDHMLSTDYADWQALFLAAVDANLESYDASYDDGLENRTWGERNMTDVRHPLSRALPGDSRWLDMPRQPIAGDSNMPRVAGPSFGASERFAVAPGDEANGIMHMPSGQTGHPLSPFFRRGHDAWVEGRATPFLPGPAAHTLTLSPSATR